MALRTCTGTSGLGEGGAAVRVVGAQADDTHADAAAAIDAGHAQGAAAAEEEQVASVRDGHADAVAAGLAGPGELERLGAAGELHVARHGGLRAAGRLEGG